MERVGWTNLSGTQQDLLDVIGNLGAEVGFETRQTVIHTKLREHCSVEFSDPETGLRVLGVTIEMDASKFVGCIIYPDEWLPDGLIPKDEDGNTHPERRINLTWLNDREGITGIVQRVRAEIDMCIDMRMRETVGLSS